MSKMIKVLCVFLFMGISSFSYANNLDDTSESVTTAIALFQQSATSEDVASFKGIKAAVKKHGIQVKIYVQEGTTTVYGCHRHSAAEDMECHLSH